MINQSGTPQECYDEDKRLYPENYNIKLIDCVILIVYLLIFFLIAII
jgi:hypothetical protein